MKNDNRDTVWIAALFDIDSVALPHIHHPLIEWVDRRVEVLDCALLIQEFVHAQPI